MKINEIRDIPWKEKTFLVTEACLMYKKLISSKEMVKKQEEITKLSDAIKFGSLENLRSLSIFETILGLLKSEYSKIIKTEYIQTYHEFQWYLNHWSKTTYYKLKHEAIDQFLYLLYA